MRFVNISYPLMLYYTRGEGVVRPLKEKISITIDSDLLAKAREMAEADDRSLSQYINLVLKKYLAELESGTN